MCQLCANSLTVNAKLNQDPTRTLLLRNAYQKDLISRFNNLKKAINKSIIDNDCFGLTNKILVFEAPPMTPSGRFVFSTTEEKVQAFMDWLDDQIEAGILEITQRDGRRIVARNAWQNIYVRSTYQKALEQGLSELARAGIETGLESASIGQFFYRPFHADKVGVLYTRQFNQLKGITDAMDQQISRVLAEGLAKGIGPRQIAKQIVNRVDSIGIVRAKVLARTEIINAHAEGTLNLFEDYGLDGVAVKAEWSTAGFNVCELCKPKEGKVYTLKEARGLIPFHPDCRCAWIPYLPDVMGKGKLKSNRLYVMRRAKIIKREIKAA
jgi:SPP1 gp7 family putative phage head morphogenesis protein